jgi:hypothetical protein
VLTATYSLYSAFTEGEQSPMVIIDFIIGFLVIRVGVRSFLREWR